MSEVNQESQMPVEVNPETDVSVEEAVRKRVTPDSTGESSNPNDPRTPGKVDRTELKVESDVNVTEESKAVRKLVTRDLTEENDPNDPRTPGKVDRTGLKVEDVTVSENG